MAFRLASVLVILAGTASPADAPLVPKTVCDVARNLTALEGASLAVLGRYSFRSTGRWLDEQACDPAAAATPRLWLQEDAENAPRPEEKLELDAEAVRNELAEVQKRTSLGKFRFGSTDYDRWAVIFGRVESWKSADTGRRFPCLYSAAAA